LPGTGNPKERKRATRMTYAVALWLTFIAGFVDVAGAVTIYNIFTAHMTCTTVKMGEDLVGADMTSAAISATVVAAFLMGSLAGRIAIEAAARARFRSVAAITLAAEAVLLACVPATASPGAHGNFSAVAAPLAMLAAAMGLQTATLTQVGPLTVHTTFVTGMLNKLCQLLSHWMFRSYDLLRGTGEDVSSTRNAKALAASQARFMFSIWLLYLAGAAAGTASARRWHSMVFFVPFFMLLLVIGIDLLQPLAIEEEREQSER
jgi:uncharacterized membrane protein YoaK (UPF0700 family)